MTAKRKIAVITEENGTIDFNFGEHGTSTLVVAQLPADMVAKLLVYGVKQKVQDSYSGKDQKDAAVSAVETVKQLMEGTWAVRRAGGGPSFTLVVQALARAMQKTEAEAQELFDRLDADVQKGLGKHAELAPHIEAIRADRAIKRAQDAAKKAEGVDSTLGAMLG